MKRVSQRVRKMSRFITKVESMSHIRIVWPLVENRLHAVIDTVSLTIETSSSRLSRSEGEGQEWVW